MEEQAHVGGPPAAGEGAPAPAPLQQQEAPRLPGRAVQDVAERYAFLREKLLQRGIKVAQLNGSRSNDAKKGNGA